MLHADKDFEESQVIIARDVLPLQESLHDEMGRRILDIQNKNLREINRQAAEAEQRFIDKYADEERAELEADPAEASP